MVVNVIDPGINPTVVIPQIYAVSFKLFSLMHIDDFSFLLSPKKIHFTVTRNYRNLQLVKI